MCVCVCVCMCVGGQGTLTVGEGSEKLTFNKIACFAKKDKKNIFEIKSNVSKPVSTRRLTILSLPL
jgi:hypothetical protein